MNDPTKATRTKIQIGDIEVDGFMLPNGNYRMSQTQAAECVQKDERNARDFLRSKAIKTLLGQGYTPAKNEAIEVDSTEQLRGQTRINPLTLDEVSAYWLWQSYRGNKRALALCMALMTETLQRRFDNAFGVARSEGEYERQLARKLQQLETSLEQLGEAYAIEDDIRQERDRFERLLRENNIDPYGLPEQE